MNTNGRIQTYNQRKSPQTKFLRVESYVTNITENNSKKKKFTIDSSDLNNFLSTNAFNRSRSNTPQLKKKFHVVNKQLENQIKSPNQKTYLSGYVKTPHSRARSIITPAEKVENGKNFFCIFSIDQKNFIRKNQIIL